MNDIPLTWFLYFSAISFGIGLMGVLARRNAIAVLMSIELMLNAANINLVAFWRYGPQPSSELIGSRISIYSESSISGVMLAIFVITIAAAEVSVGIGLILLCYRRWKSADVDQYESLSG